MDYIIKGIDAESVMLLNDYVLNQGKGEIKIDGKRASQTGLPDFIYRFFWHFVCRNYGKNSAAQSLKDSVYYGGFFNSLYTVSGKDASAVDSEFNLFLGRYLKKAGIDPCYSAAGPGGRAINAVSHCCGVPGSVYALLAEKGGEYFVITAKGGLADFSEVKLNVQGVSLKSISFFGENLLAAGSNKYGSVMICCGDDGREVLWKREFPFIYISHVYGDSSGGKIYFSALAKGQSSLFVYNMTSVALLKTGGRGTDLLYPSLAASGEVIYVRRNNVQSIMLLDSATGMSREIYRTSNTLAYPSEGPGGRIYFSETEKGITDIRCIDMSAGTIGQITYTSTSNILPLGMNDRLLFLNYNKGAYRPVFQPSYSK